MTHANQLLDCSHVDMARRKGRPVCLDTTKSRLQRLHTALWVFRADRAQKLSVYRVPTPKEPTLEFFRPRTVVRRGMDSDALQVSCRSPLADQTNGYARF